MDDKELREYHRPNSAPGTDGTPVRKAWGIANGLQCDLDYLLSETNSKGPSAYGSKHMIDMMLKHIHRELDDILVLLMDEGKDSEDK